MILCVFWVVGVGFDCFLVVVWEVYARKSGPALAGGALVVCSGFSKAVDRQL